MARNVSVRDFQQLQTSGAIVDDADDDADILRGIGAGALPVEAKPEDRAESDSVVSTASDGTLSESSGTTVDTDDEPPPSMGAQLRALLVGSECSEEMSLGMVAGRVANAAGRAGLDPTDADIVEEAERIWALFEVNRKGPREYDIIDGEVRDWRRPDTTPDRGDVTQVHQVTDDEPRFSGAGAADDLGRTAPWMVLKVPSAVEFGDDELFSSTALAHRAETLIERHPDHFDHLADMKIIYLWKKEGGKSKGRGLYGKTTKPSGLLKHFSEATFVIWLAADHCRGAGYREREIEALLFHEMLHTGVGEPDETSGRGGGPILIPHELEIFRAEVEVYGLWAPDLREVAPAFDGVARQPSLFDAMLPRDAEGAVREILDPTDDSAGVLIWPDGTALTDDEIEAMERHDLADDDEIERDSAADVAAFDADRPPAADDDDPPADHDL